MNHLLNKIKYFYMTKDEFFFIIVLIKFENNIYNAILAINIRNLYHNTILSKTT